MVDRFTVFMLTERIQVINNAQINKNPLKSP